MKNVNLTITRIFKESKGIIRDKLIRLEGDKTLSSLMSSYGWKFVPITLKSVRKAKARIRLYHKFATYLSVLNRRHGAEFVVKYLKACNLALSRFVAGNPVKTLRELEPDLPLPRLTRSGLPVIIGTRDRRSLHSKSPKVIRLYLNLFSIYRIISIPGKLKINTITDPFSGNSDYTKFVGQWAKDNFLGLTGRFRRNLELTKLEKFEMLETSSPSSTKSWTGMVTDVSLLKESALLPFLSAVMSVTCSTELQDLLKDLIKIVPSYSSELSKQFVFKPLLYDAWSFNKTGPQNGLGLRQLSKKLEAGGKVRVFAMVDSWTQTACTALHNYLLEILSRLPNDGTKDQLSAFKRANEKAIKYNCAFGYDLSAATDRLPLSIQKAIIASLFSEEFSNAWGDLLVSVPYYLIEKRKKEISSVLEIKYSVGQPMGARSSFAMLGITHHVILQLAAKMVNPLLNSWEEKYEILGDDVVIFDKSLASSYLEIMKLIGVPINESKSVIADSSPVVEFLKRISIKGIEVTPLPWKNFIKQDSFKGRLNTLIGLFLKEDSFKSNPISLFNVVMKEKSFDNRPLKDSLGLLSLMFTYAKAAKLNILDILNLMSPFSMTIKDKCFSFSNLDFKLLRKMLTDFIQKKDISDYKIYHSNYKAIKEALHIINLKKLNGYKKNFPGWKVRDMENLIIARLLNNYDSLTKKVKVSWLPQEFHIIEQRLVVWMATQNSRMDNPWLSMFPKMNPLFSDIMKYKAKDMTDSRMKYDNFTQVLNQLQDCENAMSFLRIVEREDFVPAVSKVEEGKVLKDLFKVKKVLNKMSFYTEEEQDFMENTFVAKDSINISFSWGSKIPKKKS